MKDSYKKYRQKMFDGSGRLIVNKQTNQKKIPKFGDCPKCQSSNTGQFVKKANGDRQWLCYNCDYLYIINLGNDGEEEKGN